MYKLLSCARNFPSSFGWAPVARRSRAAVVQPKVQGQLRKKFINWLVGMVEHREHLQFK